jgi:hypothetical protein
MGEFAQLDVGILGLLECLGHELWYSFLTGPGEPGGPVSR